MALKTVDVTFQNLDSSEISLTDVSHYYDSDPTKVVSSLRDDKKKPSSFMADTTTANAQVRALALASSFGLAWLGSAWLGFALRCFTLCFAERSWAKICLVLALPCLDFVRNHK